MNKLYISGIGPGGPEYMTRKAYRILQEADLIVGYTLYNDLLRREFPDKTYYSTAMTGERERCLYALRAAKGSGGMQRRQRGLRYGFSGAGTGGRTGI